MLVEMIEYGNRYSIIPTNINLALTCAVMNTKIAK